jgi:hypothetical protein
MALANMFRRKVEPVAFSHDLFQAWVMGDLESKYQEFATRWRSSEQFDETKCRYSFYVYLVSVVAVALTATVEKRPEFIRVIANFKQMAHSEARTEWSVQEDRFDNDIEEAGSSLARLIFENPSENPALSLEWPGQWLESFGVTEHNPITLFKVSHYWKTSFLNICRLFDKVKLVNRAG